MSIIIVIIVIGSENVSSVKKHFDYIHDFYKTA